jgi:hypothetical protein
MLKDFFNRRDPASVERRRILRERTKADYPDEQKEHFMSPRTDACVSNINAWLEKMYQQEEVKENEPNVDEQEGGTPND